MSQRNWLDSPSPVITVLSTRAGMIIETFTAKEWSRMTPKLMFMHSVSFACAPDGYVFKNRWGHRGEIPPTDLPTALALQACLHHYWRSQG